MDEILSAVIGALCGTISGGIVSYFIAMRIQRKDQNYRGKEDIDNILSSIDSEVSNNLKIAKENQNNASHGMSTAERHNFSMFSFVAYDKFSISINTKLKSYLGSKAIDHLINGYKQCKRFDQAFKDYKEGKRPSSRSDLIDFGGIISNFEEYQKIRKT